jgi:hypothetical protein
VFELEDITGGIGELNIFENIGFVWMLELNNITGRIEELDFIDNIDII